MGKRNKKGLSPIIATVLLISIALVLAVIIFLWARNLVGEAVMKEGSRIENSCEQINFNAEAYGGKLHIVNQGNVPLYRVEVKKKSLGTIEKIIEFGKTIGNGQTVEGSLGENINEGDEIVVVPVIIGTSGETKKTHLCTDNGINVKVEA